MKPAIPPPPITPPPRPGWAQLEMFARMTDDAVDRLRTAMEIEDFEPDAQVLHQGDAGDDMYLLEQGTVRVTVRGHEQTFFERALTAPAVFGEMALVMEAPRTADVTAETPVRCLRLTRLVFNDLVRRFPSVGEFLSRAVAERLLEQTAIQHVGKYRVIGRLGAGAVATVFEALHPGLQRSVALKMLSHTLCFHDRFREQFQREAQLIALLNHEHIVRVYDTEAAYGTHFIVMEKLHGLTLDDLIQQGQRLPYGMVRRILREVASALAYSHQKGLLHRDVKPSNVFLADEERRAKLLDFGIAVSPDASATAAGEQLFGTPYYMSPEQIRGLQLDGRSDLYSLGILAYELITGEVPFDAETIGELLDQHLHAPLPDPRQLRPDLPWDLEEFLLRATQKRPEERFVDCVQAGDFLKLATELPMVRAIELTTLAISYHPSRRQVVQQALEALRLQLEPVQGVAILHAHQHSLVPERE